ncbi:MAG: DsrE family protein [Thiohalophilus sp.]|uniref:DsrE family protein n=1 Tax=Thiohalophilus sp. TaxID=3028392 RepID=UPI00286FDD0B|nr:DsrE family protein [Thiohalophilus sp.]MDR9435672.1 DsrE family protein [Thiohalophilus sp.]
MYKMMNFVKAGLVSAVLAILSMGQSALAGPMDAEHKVIIQVSTDDARTQKIALNNAANLQKAYGMDNVDVQVVAYGPGLSLLTKNGANATRVESMAMQNINFNACANTMTKIESKKGKKPALAEGVEVVPGGVARITELQEQGYAYIRP